MDEASGLIQDSSGNGLHATTEVGSKTYEQTGPITSEPADKAIEFSASCFNVPDSTGLDSLVDTFTLEAWIKRTSTELAGGIVSGQNGAGFMRLVDSTDKLELLRSNQSVIVASTTTITDTTTWHHVVAVKATSVTIKLYIDGEDVTGTPSNNPCGNFNGIVVGADLAGGTDSFTGLLDEVAVYATALSQARIQAHYAAATVALDTVLPDADITTTGWSTAPLFSKINDDSDATVITATAS
jgi:hypothetical protein